MSVRAYLEHLFRTPSAPACYKRGREAEEHFWNSADKSSRRNAIAWYRRAAEQGHAPGQRALGWMYQCEDHDVDPREEEPTDERAWGFGTQRAERWYRRAAEQGNPLAQVQVGLWHEDNETRAMWFRRAAEQGFALGQLRFGLMLDGLPQQMWLNRAAAQGLPAGMHALGKMFDMHYDDVEYEYGDYLDDDWACLNSAPVEYATRCHAYVGRKLTAAMWCILAQRYGSAGHSLDEWMTSTELRHYLAWEAECEELGSDLFPDRINPCPEQLSSFWFDSEVGADHWSFGQYTEAERLAGRWTAMHPRLSSPQGTRADPAHGSRTNTNGRRT